MTEHDELTAEDGQLLDLVTAVLVDPNVHTDLRMRLHNEITELLRTTHEHLYGPPGRQPHEPPAPSDEGQLPDMLRAVLVDPNLHTDLRMRLHREIPELLRAARRRTAVPAQPPSRG
jgi:hypothetical protein